MTVHCDILIHNATVATMHSGGLPYGQIDAAVVAIKDGTIVYLGSASDCHYHSEDTINGDGKWLLPGLIDCHTHLVYGGDRASEFEQRLQGVSYADIAKAGGGINSTVKATREASFESLLECALKRSKRLLAEGVTTVEIKSGYGLDLDTEIKMLRVAKQIAVELPMHVETTFLGAHAVPVEYAQRADDYLDFVCQEVLPTVAKQQLAGSVDVFCEAIGFSPAQTQRVFAAAQQHGLNIKAHVEQLSDLKGAVLAAAAGALSVDHLEYLAVEDIPAIQRAGSVAVLLPAAFYYLNETRKPPIAALRQHCVPMAVATDLNPGSAPLASLLTAMNMASVLFGLTPEEALRGATVNAAKALGLSKKGAIAEHMDADLGLWDIQHPSELVYAVNQHRPELIISGGRRVDH